MIAVIPGSFDPITLGHCDVIARAALLFDELHIVVTHNPHKTALLPPEERVSLITEVTETIQENVRNSANKTQGACQRPTSPNFVITSWDEGLLVEYCTHVGARFLVKGIRSNSDIGYEIPMATVNRDLADVETLFLLPDQSHAHISSSLVRQIASLGGNIAPYVPVVVARFLSEQYDRAHDE